MAAFRIKAHRLSLSLSLSNSGPCDLLFGAAPEGQLGHVHMPKGYGHTGRMLMADEQLRHGRPTHQATHIGPCFDKLRAHVGVSIGQRGRAPLEAGPSEGARQNTKPRCCSRAGGVTRWKSPFKEGSTCILMMEMPLGRTSHPRRADTAEGAGRDRRSGREERIPGAGAAS